MPEFEIGKMLTWTAYGIFILFILSIIFTAFLKQFFETKNNAKIEYLKKLNKTISNNNIKEKGEN